jgi:Ca2+/Na+ antiporter
LTKRGHRLAFSNGIIVLAVIALALILGTGAHVDKLVAFYAIGVFTGFTLAGFGMARYFTTHRDGRWRIKVLINTLVGAVAGAVVLIFAITKFTEGAWLVVLVFSIMVVLLLRLRRTCQEEDALLRALPQRESGPPMAGNQVLLLVDRVDLATLRALTYARNLRPTSMRAVHYMIDPDHASALRAAWDRFDRLDLPLEIVDCPDRRLGRAALELAERGLVSGPPNGVVTVLLPRRQYGVLVGRLLHDRTADEIAAAVSQTRGVAAIIVPFNASTRPRVDTPRGTDRRASGASRAGVHHRAHSAEPRDHRRGAAPGLGRVAGPDQVGRVVEHRRQSGLPRRAVRRVGRGDAALLRPAQDRGPGPRGAGARRGPGRGTSWLPGHGQPVLPDPPVAIVVLPRSVSRR